MSYIDVTGKTEEEAIQKALTQLGMDRDDVSVEILERAKSGFFGFGASPAKVRVTYGLEDAPMEDVVIPAPVKPTVKKQEKPLQEVKKDTVKRQPNREEKNAEAPKAPQKKEEKKPEPKKAAPVEKKEVKVVVETEKEGICTDENAQRITEFLKGLLEHMESPAQINVYETEKSHYSVILEGEKLGQLIGRRGETLDAIQQLTNYAVNSGKEKRIRVHVDAENYRAKREQSLESLANKVAAKVTKYRRSVTLEPMNAYERHVIHATLQDVPGITTYSIGSEPNRRVVVAVDREAK